MTLPGARQNGFQIWLIARLDGRAAVLRRGETARLTAWPLRARAAPSGLSLPDKGVPWLNSKPAWAVSEAQPDRHRTQPLLAVHSVDQGGEPAGFNLAGFRLHENELPCGKKRPAGGK